MNNFVVMLEYITVIEKMTETDYSDVITPTIVFYMLINLEKEHDETLC